MNHHAMGNIAVLWRKRHKPKKERVAMMAALYGMSFDPIIIVGASGNIPTPNLTTGPNGSASGENGISAALVVGQFDCGRPNGFRGLIDSARIAGWNQHFI